MTEVLLNEFCKELCKEYNIEPTKKVKYKLTDFKFKNGKRKISCRYDSIIVDNDGNEYPYMLDQQTRNNDKLVNFNHIYTIFNKSLVEILEEGKIYIKSKKTNICEGGGWYSKGRIYYYKDIYCESN